MHEWTGKIQASWSDSVIYNFQINMQRKEQASNIHLCLYQVTHCNALQAQVSMVNRARLANTSQVSKKQLCPPWENFVTGKENLHGWSIQQNQVQTVFLQQAFCQMSHQQVWRWHWPSYGRGGRLLLLNLVFICSQLPRGEKSYFELKLSTFHPSPKVT